MLPGRAVAETLSWSPSTPPDLLGRRYATAHHLVPQRKERRRPVVVRRPAPFGCVAWKRCRLTPHEARHARRKGASFLRIELGVPIEIVEPAVVQIVRREQSAVAVQLVHRWRVGRLFREHLGLLRRQVALFQIAGRTGGDDVFPGGLATLAAGDDVIEGEIVGRGAILADEAVAEENVETGESG